MPRPNETSTPSAAPTLKLSHPADEFDALAELFLGGDPAETAPGSQTRAPATAQTMPPVAPPPEPALISSPATTLELEMLILGHLPVRASPWVSQYARITAEKLGAPVALARSVGADLAIDVFGLQAHARPEAPSTDFASAVAGVVATTRHWILQLDEVTEPQLAPDSRISALTLVTGANEAAVVAAYRTLKSLAPSAEESPADDANPDQPRFRVAVVGAEGQAAVETAAKLRQAARVFLGRPVGFAGAIARIGPTGAVSFYRGPAPATGPALIDALIETTATRSPCPSTCARHDGPRGDEPRFAPTPVRTAPQAAKMPAGDPASKGLAARLASLGLGPLVARCPDDTLAELAVDASGRLHVLRDSDGPDSYQRLVGVIAWATRHRDLLALASGAGARIDTAAGVVGHLFTSDPKSFLHVAHAEVKLHLFAPANVGSGEGWCCVALN